MADYPTCASMVPDEPTFKADFKNDKSSYGNRSAGKPVELRKPGDEEKNM